MLLFLLRDNFREPPYVPHRATPTTGWYAAELLAAGLFVSVWCALRLLVGRGEGSAVDAVLAVPSLVLGLWVVFRSVRELTVATRVCRRGKGLRAG
jgi:hypothetical protein